MKFKTTIRILSLASLLALPLSSRAGNWGTWTDIAASKKVGTFSFTLSGGFRSQNNFKNVDRWSVGFEVAYKPIKFFEISTGYDYLYSYSMEEKEKKYETWQERDDDGNIKEVSEYNGYNLKHPYWRSKNRWTVDVTGKLPVGRFTFSLRERYQLTRSLHTSRTVDKYRIDDDTEALYFRESERNDRPAKNDSRLRSRLTGEYNIRHCPLTPYLYGEIFNDLQSGMHLVKTRIGAGVEYKVSTHSKIDFGYVWQDNNGDNDETTPNIIDISYKYKF